MTTDKADAPSLDALHNLIQGVAKNIVEKLYGPHGPHWGTRFSDLEELAVQVGRAISCQLLDEALRRQATESPPAEDQLCPSCRGPLTTGQPEPRIVTTRVGDAQWSEPQSTCPRCRRAFFPPVETTGH